MAVIASAMRVISAPGLRACDNTDINDDGDCVKADSDNCSMVASAD